MILNELGWVFIYIFTFGLSDFFVKKYIKSEDKYLLYYFFIGFVGLFLLLKKS